MKTSPRLHHFLLAASSLLAANSAFAQSTWNQTGGGTLSWQDSANWTGGVPNGAGAVANVNNNSGFQTINLNGAVIVGTLRLGDSDGSNSTTLANGTGGSLTFNNSGSGALLTHTTGRITDAISATVTLADNLEANIGIDLAMSGSLTESGGARSFTKSGAGTLTLSSGTISHTGTTTVSAGQLTISTLSVSLASNISIAGGATLARTGDAGFTLTSGKFVEGTGTGTARFIVATGGSFDTKSLTTVGNNIIRHTGSGTLSLDRLEIRGAGNEITQGNILSGADGVRRGLVIGNGVGITGTLTISGGTFESDGLAEDIISNGSTTSGGTLNITGGHYTNVNATTGDLVVGFNGGTGNLNISSGSATSGRIVFGSATVTMATTGNVNLSGTGILETGGFARGTITTGSHTSNITFDGGTLRARGANNADFMRDDVITGTALVRVGGVKIDTNTYNIGISQALTEDGTSTGGGLTKQGDGTLTLSGTNTYTGATSITGGTLALSGSGSIANSSTITINSSTNLSVTGLTGNFTVGASQSVGGSGTIISTTGKTVFANGTLTPGNSPGTLIQDGGTLQLGVGGDLNWQVYDANAPAGIGGYDTVSLINGATLDLSLLSAGNTYNINLWSLSAIGSDVNGNAIDFNNTLNQAWTLFSTGTAITGGFDTSKFTINTGSFNGTSGFSNTLNGSFDVALADGGTDLVLTYTAVPEPAAAFLGSLGLLALLRRRR